MRDYPKIDYEKVDYSSVADEGGVFDTRAYDFILDALVRAEATARQDSREGISSDDVCQAVYSLALDVFGVLAYEVLAAWGLATYSRVRDAMRLLGEARILRYLPDDTDTYFWDETSLRDDLESAFDPHADDGGGEDDF